MNPAKSSQVSNSNEIVKKEYFPFLVSDVLTREFLEASKEAEIITSSSKKT